jgi:CRISPR-associated endonuclease Cas2
MKSYLVSYDIFNPKRLRQVAKVVESYKLKGQKSSWETPLDHKLMKELVKKLEEIIEEEDKVNIIAVMGEPILLGNAKSIEHKKGGIVIL